MEKETINSNINSTIQDPSKGLTEVIARWHEIRQSKMDESLEEMVRIWTTLSPYQKADLMQKAIRASQVNQEIDHLRETQMAVLKARDLNVKGK